jgi:DNA segregation ATPase FtsK/SpoIIIE, S-DNA-T family
MARKKGRKKKQVSWKDILTLKDDRARKITGTLFLLFGIYLGIAFTSYMFTWHLDQDKVLQFNWALIWEDSVRVENWLGRLGAIVSNAFFYWGFGLPSFIFVWVCFRLGYHIIKNKPATEFLLWLQHQLGVLLFLSIFLEFVFHSSGFSWGGAFGESACEWMSHFIGQAGLFLLLLFCLVAAIIWLFNPSFQQLEYQLDGARMRIPGWHFFTGKSAASSGMGHTDSDVAVTDPANADSEGDDATPPKDPFGEGKFFPKSNLKLDLDEPLEEEDDTVVTTRPNQIDDKASATELEISESEDMVHEHSEIAQLSEEDESASPSQKLTPYDPHSGLTTYEMPDIEYLEDYADHKVEIDRDELESNKDQIIATLLNYKIEITKIRATIGPTVTLYEIVPAPGVRISRIKGLEDDIALSLSALGIRIIAPIPGKGTIGIEVPNKKRQIVALKEVLSSDRFKNAKMELPIALGKTISNEVFVADLAKMPHLLIAGATGQGKSVGINTVLMSLLYKKHPSEIKLVLIDPKKVELPIYNELIKHYLAFLPDQSEPIVTETSRVIYTLNSLCIEMDNRYNLLKKARCRNVKEYNEKYKARRLNPENGHAFMPHIILVIDEFADLIMTAGKEIEMPIGRLAQLARAVGIHLIIATQRPSVKIITGLIKANFPARIAFRVTSNVDSRTILDCGGAEHLIGRGDMLLSVGSDIIRLQCAFVDTPEVEKVIDHIKNQPGYAEPFYLPEYKGEDEAGSMTSVRWADLDEMFEEAARLVVQNQHGSTSMLQRRLQLGYNRAGRIMDQLEATGIVGAAEGSKPREVLVMSDMELTQIVDHLRDNAY